MRRILQVAGGGAVAMTLMACYGMPPGYFPPNNLPADTDCTDPGEDIDGDGYCKQLDCDETNAAVFPGAEEIAGDGLDSDCDGSDDPAEAQTPMPIDSGSVLNPVPGPQ